VGGFFTLNEAFQLSPFRRGAPFFVEGFYKGVSVTLYDWNADDFVFDNTNIETSGNGTWSGGYGNYARWVLSTGGDYTNKVVPWIIDDSGTLTMRFADVAHTRDNPDDFTEVAEGSRIGSSGRQCVVSLTGVTFDGGNMVDGDHYVQWRWIHDAKGDTSYAYTTVMNVASNVITVYSKRAIATSYTTVADTKVSGNIDWQITWDPDDNTWTINNENEKRFDAISTTNPGSNNSDVSFETSGGVVSQEISTLGTAADADDHRIWAIGVEEV